MKVVLDSNVLLAAFRAHGFCHALVAICVDRHALILSEAIPAEVEEHLSGKFGASAAHARQVAAFLRAECHIVQPAAISTESCHDTDDLPIWGTALAGKADCLGTGDQALLSLETFQGVRILSPRDFYEQLC